jgi:hypothetical protein
MNFYADRQGAIGGLGKCQLCHKRFRRGQRRMLIDIADGILHTRKMHLHCAFWRVAKLMLTRPKSRVLHSRLFQIKCPQCNTVLREIQYPSYEQTPITRYALCTNCMPNVHTRLNARI